MGQPALFAVGIMNIMAKKTSIAVITDRLEPHVQEVMDLLHAIKVGGFIVHDVKDWIKTKDGKYLTWVSVEKAEVGWCNVCGESTKTHRLRCEKCGARKSAY